MILNIMDDCPHCLKRNAPFRLAAPDGRREARRGEKGRPAPPSAYGSVWVCQNCFKSLAASIFVVL